jgi:hypothetical protein
MLFLNAFVLSLPPEPHEAASHEEKGGRFGYDLRILIEGNPHTIPYAGAPQVNTQTIAQKI